MRGNYESLVSMGKKANIWVGFGSIWFIGGGACLGLGLCVWVVLFCYRAALADLELAM